VFLAGCTAALELAEHHRPAAPRLLAVDLEGTKRGRWPC
jgi:hypothetical protein